MKEKMKSENPKSNDINEELVNTVNSDDISEGENDEQTEVSNDANSEEAVKIAELEKSLCDEKDKYIRLAAEYDNFRKRSLNDKINAAAEASARTIVEILSVIDNFERALSSECTDANYKKGVEMIFNQYKEVLNKLGVTELDAVGKPFDPNFHFAVNQTQDENFGENTVCQVFQKGYMLGDRVIRFAMVVVANP